MMIMGLGISLLFELFCETSIWLPSEPVWPPGESRQSMEAITISFYAQQLGERC